MDDFDYKKHSLERLEEWVHDCLSAAEASPQEIYDVIKKTVEEQYYCYKNHTSRAYELLALLNGNGKGHIKEYDDCVDKVLSCDKDDLSPECKNAWSSFWKDIEEDGKIIFKTDGEDRTPRWEDIMPPWGHSDMEALHYTEEELNAMCDAAQEQQDKVKKWVLPVEMHPSGECFVVFPDDLLEASDLTEGDQVEWIDQGNGSYVLKKVVK